jgi:hypothetical protein
VLGLDFSGARRAERKIWLATALAEGERLRVTDVRRAADLPGSGPGRELSLRALVDHLCDAAGRLGGFAAGFDFPFGLHRSLVPDRDFGAFLRAFPGRYPTAEAFLAACRAAGRETELRRDCDAEARTPFVPHNLRLYRQTYHGIRDVLLPLAERAGACVLPQQGPLPGRPWLLETCPASALKREGRARPYKGRTPAHRAARAGHLAWLEGAGMIVVDKTLRGLALEDAEGDALDSLIAAWITHRALASAQALLPPLSAAHRIEGYVYY